MTAPVYVDAAIHEWRGRKWCHLFSADLDALHGFAKRLGLLRGWFQEPPKASWPHYDVTSTKRDAAILLGAHAADRKTLLLVSGEAMVAWCRINRPDLVAWAMERRDRQAQRVAGLASTPS